MFVTCGEEVKVPYSGREYLFEEYAQFGYVYSVDAGLGAAAIATGKCGEVTDYDGPTEIPSSKPL